MALRALKRAFWVFYDNILKGMLANIIIFITIFIPAIIAVKLRFYEGIVISALLSYHLFAPPLMRYWHLRMRSSENRGFFREYFEVFKETALKSLAIFLLNMLFIGIVFAVINFYRSNPSLGKAGAVLGGLGIWVVLLFAAIQVFLLPIFALDEKKRVFVSYKKAAIMLMAAPFSSFFLLLVFSYLCVLLYPAAVYVYGGGALPTFTALFTLFPVFLFPFVSLNFILLTQLNAALVLFEKHGVYEPAPEEFENRNLATLFKPWDAK